MFVADGFAAPSLASLSVGASAEAVSCRLMWSGAFLTVTAEAGVGGTTVVAVVGVGLDDGVGVELLWLPASWVAVSLVESHGEGMRKRRQSKKPCEGGKRGRGQY